MDPASLLEALFVSLEIYETLVEYHVECVRIFKLLVKVTAGDCPLANEVADISEDLHYFNEILLSLGGKIARTMDAVKALALASEE